MKYARAAGAWVNVSQAIWRGPSRIVATAGQRHACQAAVGVLVSAKAIALPAAQSLVANAEPGRAAIRASGVHVEARASASQDKTIRRCVGAVELSLVRA
jgi:hypothetical protein